MKCRSNYYAKLFRKIYKIQKKIMSSNFRKLLMISVNFNLLISIIVENICRKFKIRVIDMIILFIIDIR